MPLGRSAGIVSSKSASQPASSRSSRWKWMAPYSPGRRRQSVSSPVKSWPVTARVGRLIVVPWRSWPETSVITSLSMSRLKSQAPMRSAATVSRTSGASARSSRAASSSARPISRGRSSRPSKCRVRRSPPAVAARTSASVSSAIGPPPVASRWVASPVSAPGSRHGQVAHRRDPVPEPSAPRSTSATAATRSPSRSRVCAPARPMTASSVPVFARQPAPSRRHRTDDRGSR